MELFVELKEFIEIGAKKAGSLTELGNALGQKQSHMSNAKAHTRPLPLDAAVRLADYIGADLRAVIAANELVTEKKEEKRAFWSPFVQSAKAASYAAALMIVTSFVTPSPANAEPVYKVTRDSLYYVKLLRLIALLKKLELNGIRKTIHGMIERFFTAMQPRLSLRIAQI